MSQTNPSLPDNIGPRECDMLDLLDERGTLTVTDFRDELGLSNGQVNYSLDKLEGKDFIVLHHPENNGSGIPEAKEAELTEEGRHAIDWYDISTDSMTVAKRVDRLERQLQREREAREEAEEKLELALKLLGVTDDNILPDVLKMRAGFVGLNGYYSEQGLNINAHMPDGTMDAVEDLRQDVQSATDD